LAGRAGLVVKGRWLVFHRSFVSAFMLLTALAVSSPVAKAFDESKYPDWKGKWGRGGIAPRWVAAVQKAPRATGFHELLDQNTADQKAGGHGMEPSWMWLPPGMPRIMNVFEPMEIVITPWTTYVLISHIQDNRRIFTDGRDWPLQIEPTFHGYSIGKWIDT